MRRFFVDPSGVKEGEAVLSEAESRHALSVLRLKIGDAVELFDGAGCVYDGVVIDAENRGRLRVSVGRKRETVVSGIEVTLAVSVIRPERMDWLVQKATELGAGVIQPIRTERSVVRLSAERWKGKAEKWRKIALESSKQCGRSTLPAIEEVCDFDLFLSRLGQYDLAVIPTLAVPGKSFAAVLNSGMKKAAALIGPEGDFSHEEVRRAVSSGAQPVTLGSLVWRSETAAIYALSGFHFFSQQVSAKGERDA